MQIGKFAETAVPASLSIRLTAQAADEIRHGSADLGRAVFLNEMDAFHRDLRLVRPRPAELSCAALYEHPRVGVDKQLRYRAGGQPLRVGRDPRRDISRLPVQRHFP